MNNSQKNIETDVNELKKIISVELSEIVDLLESKRIDIARKEINKEASDGSRK